LRNAGGTDGEAHNCGQPRKPNNFFGFPNEFVEQELGVSATSRNWATVTRLAELLGE
jgi:hypothetical protein